MVIMETSNISIVAGSVLGLSLLFTVAAPASAQESAEDGRSDVVRGAELFSRNCQRCHRPRGPGEWNNREWVIIMQHMETRAHLTRSRARAIRRFLMASNAAATSPGREREGIARDAERPEITDEIVEEGRRIARGQGACVSCHGTDLDGGPVAPSLTDDRWRSGTGTYRDVLEAVRNGVDGTAMAAYPGGITDEMARQVAAYVWALSQGRFER